ncbi:hypothetical protein SDRG_13187 [Saprolegnia diclina VS20]|uniref:Helicase-associated domain-containing protein n=1 Tax=Saprolegnia diclina (strain VS20) TaxID=1156394 RepID=T0Q3A1_SAPDV|nr:hypothetical protein SDRG_13187 [Saprolegnia diclina VS20]EQC29031.1 hypothetical protein SDRG_13187 [Saprolegnia diclina VS20]|eukprot:XP_008617490.1 hypothetical protein SDRG_13187 [Saprolegnia diclina VS20]
MRALLGEDLRTYVDVIAIVRQLQAPTSEFTTLPSRFVVPAETPWPPALHRRVLDVAKLRKHYAAKLLPRSVVDELDLLGFVWDPKEHSWVLRLCALRTYKDLYGHVAVPYEFVVPETSDVWPLDVRGTKLGVAVTNLRSRAASLSPSRKQTLDDLGFVWDSQELVFQIKLQALAAFASLFHHVAVPFEFKVPEASPLWPPPCWGLKLGRAVHDLRCRAGSLTLHRRRQLDALGFVWDSHESSWDMKVRAMELYKELHGNLLVPQDFVVPPTLPWPRPMWGLKLGQAITNIRFRTTTIDRRAQLEELGFVWDYPELRGEAKLLLALTKPTPASSLITSCAPMRRKQRMDAWHATEVES